MQATDAAAREGTTRSPIALRDMLARISLEIDGAAGTLEGFQNVLSQAAGLHDEVPSEHLQSLDLLHQVLRDLGSVLAELASRQIPGDGVDTATVLDRCKISDVATRLRGDRTPPASRDVELF